MMVFTEEAKGVIKFLRETKTLWNKAFSGRVPCKGVKVHIILLFIMKVIQKQLRGPLIMAHFMKTSLNNVL